MFERDHSLALIQNNIPQSIHLVHFQQSSRAVIESKRQTPVYNKTCVKATASNVNFLGKSPGFDNPRKRGIKIHIRVSSIYVPTNTRSTFEGLGLDCQRRGHQLVSNGVHKTVVFWVIEQQLVEFVCYLTNECKQYVSKFRSVKLSR